MSTESSSQKRILKNSVFLAIRMVVIMFISLFTTRYLLNNLGVEDYGVYNVTLGIVLMCTFLSPSLTNAIQRFYNYELGKTGYEGATKVLNTGLLIQSIMAIIIIIGCETIGLWYISNHLVVPEGREHATMVVYQISVFSTALSMLQVPFVASIMAHEDMNYYAVINILDAFFKLIIAILIKNAPFDRLIFYGLLLFCISVFDFLAYLIYSIRRYKDVRLNFKYDLKMVKSLGSFTGWNLFETIARLLKDQGCNLLFNFFFGTVINAARGVANQVTYAFTGIVESTIMASRPQMVQSYAQGKVKTSTSMFYTLSKGTLFLVYLLSLPVFLEIDYILHLWLGASIPECASILIRLSIIVTLFDKLASPVTALIHATGNIKKYHICSGLLNIIVLPLSWLTLYLGYGIVEVYIITIIFTILAQTLYIFILKHLVNITLLEYFRLVVLRFLLILPSAIVPIIFFLYFEEGLLRFLYVSISSVCLSLVFIYLIGLNSSERTLVKSTLKLI